MLTTSELDPDSTPAEVLHWSVATQQATTVLALAGEIDLGSAATLGEALDQLLDDRRSPLIVDLARVTFLDSTGIHCLLSASKRAAAVGCTLVVRNPSATVTRIFAICGVDKILLEPPEAEPRPDGATPNGR